MASGGMRPGAPQNNPANVSATGGAGQSGDYKGFAYGQNKALNDSRVQGNQAVASVSASPQAMPEHNMPKLGSLLDPTNNPSEPITAGVDFGPGVGSEALPKGYTANTRPDENKAVIAQYLPDLIQAAGYKDAPDSFKRFVNYLVSQNG